jgi:hypothetical protein
LFVYLLSSVYFQNPYFKPSTSLSLDFTGFLVLTPPLLTETAKMPSKGEGHCVSKGSYKLKVECASDYRCDQLFGHEREPGQKPEPEIEPTDELHNSSSEKSLDMEKLMASLGEGAQDPSSLQ